MLFYSRKPLVGTSSKGQIDVDQTYMPLVFVLLRYFDGSFWYWLINIVFYGWFEKEGRKIIGDSQTHKSKINWQRHG